jgi:hypothetical protein
MEELIMNKQKNSESGQAIVLLALAIIVLLGLTALAIDGGMAFSDRRYAQNASDASSLAGGGAAAMTLDNNNVNYSNWNCTHPSISALARQEAINAAIGRAASNGFVLDDDISDLNGVLFECGIEFTGGWWEKYIDVTTKISSTTDAYLGRLFFEGQFTNNVSAVTRIRPRTPIAMGNAIVALSDVCQGNIGGIKFAGSSQTVVTGGGVYSNACISSDGGAGLYLDGHNITCTGEGCDSGYSAAANRPPAYVNSEPLPPDTYKVDPPVCTGLPYRGSITGGSATPIQPGIYDRIRLTNDKDVLIMEPGLYCVNNEFTNNGGTLTGHGITIYMTGGNFSISGNTHATNISAPPAIKCKYCPPPLPGILVYMDPSVHAGVVSILGNAASTYQGVIYVPNGSIEAGGTAGQDSPIHAQLVGREVKIHGNAEVRVNFDGGITYNFPPKLELYK